jgi:hypothetical protein
MKNIDCIVNDNNEDENDDNNDDNYDDNLIDIVSVDVEQPSTFIKVHRGRPLKKPGFDQQKVYPKKKMVSKDVLEERLKKRREANKRTAHQSRQRVKKYIEYLKDTVFEEISNVNSINTIGRQLQKEQDMLLNYYCFLQLFMNAIEENKYMSYNKYAINNDFDKEDTYLTQLLPVDELLNVPKFVSDLIGCQS